MSGLFPLRSGAGPRLGGRQLLLSSGTTLLVGASGRCSGRRAQVKPPFPVPVEW